MELDPGSSCKQMDPDPANKYILGLENFFPQEQILWFSLFLKSQIDKLKV